MSLKENLYEIENTEARKRLISLFDDESFTEIDAFAKSSNGKVEAVAGFGCVYGTPVYAFAQDSSVNHGAISKAHAEKIKKVYELAAKTGAPVIGIYDSNGVSLNEGIEALSAYGEMLKLSNSISGVVPQISVVTGACVGTSALVASAADVVILSKDAQFYLGAPSEMTADECMKAGLASIVADDADKAIETAKEVIAKMPMNNLSPAPIVEFTEDASVLDSSSSVKDVIKAVADADSSLELAADFGANVTTTLSSVAGSTVGFIGYTGTITADDCSKAYRFVRLCDAFNIPLVSVIATDGFDKSADAAVNGVLRQASMLTSAYADATTPKIAVITGKAIGSAYISLAGRAANADVVFAWKDAVVSALDVDAAVAFMYNDRLAAGENRNELVNEYINNEASPLVAASMGQIDDVFDACATRAKLISSLDMLSGKRVSTLPKKHTVI